MKTLFILPAVVAALVLMQSCSNVPNAVVMENSPIIDKSDIDIKSLDEVHAISRVIPEDAEKIENELNENLLYKGIKTKNLLEKLSEITTFLSYDQTHPEKLATHRLNKLEIKELIHAINPSINKTNAAKYAALIATTSKKMQVDPKIMVAIMDTESNFKQDAVSSTGDLSVAQINIKVWNPEFKRLKMPLIHEKKLKADPHYATEIMGKILALLKKRYGLKDPQSWFARYHSSTEKYKKIYFSKLNLKFKKMDIHSEGKKKKIVL